jgi:mercuric ion transport protein
MVPTVTSEAGRKGVPGAGRGRVRLLAGGGLVGAVLASSCCLLPLALFSLGLGGAWVGNLTALAPYQPLFVVLALASLGGGFYFAYRRPAGACAEEACAPPASRRLVKATLWIGSALVAAALAFPFAAPYLLGV